MEQEGGGQAACTVSFTSPWPGAGPCPAPTPCTAAVAVAAAAGLAGGLAGTAGLLWRGCLACAGQSAPALISGPASQPMAQSPGRPFTLAERTLHRPLLRGHFGIILERATPY